MKRLIFVALSLSLAAGSASAGKALLDQNFRELAGTKVVNLQSTYGGQVLLVVNTASKCGFTPAVRRARGDERQVQGPGLLGAWLPVERFHGPGAG